MRNRKNSFFYGWMILMACTAIGFVSNGVQASFGVFFKSLEADFGLTRTSTSGIYSAHLLLSMVFAISGGWAIDRYGFRAPVIVMGLFVGLGLILTSQANTLWHLYISYSLLLAMGIGAIAPTLFAVASGWFIKRRGLILGIIIAGFYIGISVFAPITAYLISSYGWRTSFLILSLSGFLLIIPFALLLKSAPSEAAVLREGEMLDAANFDLTETQANSQLKDYSLNQAVKTKSFWVLFLNWFLGGFIFYSLMAHLVPHATDLGILPAAAVSIISLFSSVSIVGSVLVGLISDRIGKRRSLLGCSLFMGAAMFWLVWSSNLWALYLYAVAFGLSFGGFMPPLAALIGDTFGLRHLGKIQAVMEASWMLGGALGPIFVGYLFDRSGGYFISFLVLTVTALVPGVLIILLKPPKDS